MARPKIELTEEQMGIIQGASIYQCPDEEIAALLQISYSTFKRRKREDPKLSEAIEAGRDAGKRLLRSIQWDKAIGGNVVMLIWLGKQYLGQSDKTDFLGKDGKPFEFTIAINGDPNSKNGGPDNEEDFENPGSPLIQ